MGCRPKGIDITQLLDDLIHVWMSCDRKMEDFTTPVIKHKKDIQRGEVERRDLEEIDRP